MIRTMKVNIKMKDDNVVVEASTDGHLLVRVGYKAEEFSKEIMTSSGIGVDVRIPSLGERIRNVMEGFFNERDFA